MFGVAISVSGTIAKPLAPSLLLDSSASISRRCRPSSQLIARLPRLAPRNGIGREAAPRPGNRSFAQLTGQRAYAAIGLPVLLPVLGPLGTLRPAEIAGPAVDSVRWREYCFRSG